MKKTQKKNQKTTIAKKQKFSYAPDIESTKSLDIKKKYGLFINGKFCEAKNKKTFKSFNPATGDVLTHISLASKEDVDKAIGAAKKAFPLWKNLSGSERGKYLFRIARLIQERAKEFALCETLDGGKPIKESLNIDIPLVAKHFFYYAGWADKLEYIFPGKKIEPHGVCGQIIPWNFPLLMAAWKIAPALATGNTVVLKPAEQTSLTALLLCEVFQEAKLPAGVVNIITGEGETGANLVSHPDVKKIAFTGSTEIGKIIAQNVAGTPKKLTLELGGKSPHIIFEDGAIDQAVEAVINGIYFNQGHVCCAGSRVLVQESIKDIFIKKLKKRMSLLRVGNPLDKNTDMGAINSKQEWEKIKKLINLGKKEGGNFFEIEGSLPRKGYFLKPCVFYDQTPASSLARVEIFGPVLSVISFRTPDEAVKMANDTEYGLAAGLWTEKSSKLLKLTRELKAGVIWANTYNKFDPASPFGGFKESGFGREGGVHGLKAYVEVKS